MSVFVHTQGIKTVHEGSGGQKMAKFCPCICWMTPNGEPPVPLKMSKCDMVP